jgi:hypothetical protein
MIKKWREIGIKANIKHQALVDSILDIQVGLLMKSEDEGFKEKITVRFRTLELIFKYTNLKIKINNVIFGLK